MNAAIQANGGRFIYLVKHPSAKIAISLFPTPSPRSVIGWVRDQKLCLSLQEAPSSSLPTLGSLGKTFEESSDFRTILDNFLRASIEHSEYYKSQAVALKQGWMHIADERASQVYGRTLDADDIFGMVRVQNGTIIKGSYNSMPTHRLISTLGLFKLNASIEEDFFKQLQLS